MDTAAVERLIESGVPDARAEVTTPRNPDDDAHFAAIVVSPAFEGASLVDRHQRVYDALDEHMTDEIHAIELTTYTPEEYGE
jgi:stress-induced morphogen